MSRFNPDLLLRDELSYEALLRDLPHVDVRVAELRRNLRGKNQDLPIDINRLKVLELDNEVETCVAKYNELTSLTQTIPEEKSPVEILRTQYRVEHLTRRISNLLTWPDITSIPSEIQKFAEQALQQLPGITRNIRRASDKFSAVEIQEALARMTLSPLSSPTADPKTVIAANNDEPPITKTTEVQPSTSSMVETVQPAANISMVQVEQIIPSSRIPFDTTDHSVSHPFSLTTQSQYRINPPPLLPIETEMPHRNQSRREVNYHPNLYGKIAHPMERILTQIPCTDGLNVQKLVTFLKGLLDIKDIPHVTDDQALTVLLAYVRPPLKDRVQDAVNNQLSIDRLHTQIIQHFIPTGIYDELKRNTVMRTQGHGERLANFIAEVRQAARVLKVDLTEFELVETILSRLSPEERSRLALISRPRNFTELEQCCIYSSNVWYADQNRKNLRANDPSRTQTQPTITFPNTRNALNPQNNSESTPTNRNHTHRKSWTPSRPNMHPNETPRCYNCNERGHYSRNCRKEKKTRNTGFPKNVSD